MKPKTFKQAVTKYRRLDAFRFWITETAKLLILSAGGLPLLLILDNLLGLPSGVRCFFLIAYLLILFAGIILACRRFFRNIPDDRTCALALEHAAGIRDNSLVNAVCFETDPSVPESLRSLFRKNADSITDRLRFSAWAPQMKPLLSGLFCVLLFAAGYLLIFPRHAQNALTRFLHPSSNLSALNFVQFDIRPGDCCIPRGSSLTIQARAWKDGHAVSGLKLCVRGKNTPVLYPVRNGSCTLNSVTEDLEYSILANGESSRTFMIRITPPPEIRSFAMTVQPPAYTGLKTVQTNLLKTPENVFPAGSDVRIVFSSAPGTLGTLSHDGRPHFFPDSFTLDKDKHLELTLENGTPPMRFPNVWTGWIRAKADQPPVPHFMNAKTNLDVLYGQNIAVEMSSTDDYGTAELILTATVEKRSFELKKYIYPLPGSKRIREILLLRPTAALVPQGSVLELTLSARDYAGNTAKSPVHITIHPADPQAILRRAGNGKDSGKCYENLFRAIALQTETRAMIAPRVKGMNGHELNRLVNSQIKVRQLIDESANYGTKAKLPNMFLQAIRSLSANYAVPLVKDSTALRKRQNKDAANAIVLKQTRLISLLKKLTGMLALNERKKEENQQKKAEMEAEKELYDQLKGLKDKLDDFKRAQLRIKSDTEAFDPKKTEDFSEGEEKLLGDLAARELEWAKFFRAAFSDLSKLQNQDFSNSAMADEFMEMYEELQKAGSALKAKKIEIATLAEANAAANADSIAANIERWLADKADYIKWNSEEDGKEKDTNLTDLPAELNDIIGDLIEQEGEEGEDSVQDSTNSFTWDTDDGLGWTAGDGTIDSMQAKGVTGNLLPNTNEVGGRSGEGRSGRSSGQFVEKEATGKGGRKTPERLVQSPFEKGTVTDKSKDAQGGATGGGKQSGVGGEGLAGVTPDQDQRTGARLSGNQGELRQRTRAMLKALTDRNLPTGDIRDALAQLDKMEKLGNGSGTDIRRYRSEALNSLRRARAVLETAVAADSERKRAGRREAWSVKHTRTETVPDAYGDCVGEYFKAIASEGEQTR